jgi:magnesium chelatase subunit D
MTHHIKRVVLPFTALVGQEKLKKALVLNAINPNLCGVLIRGEKGTAKSTAVRALAALLPEIEVAQCPFCCSPSDPALQCDLCHDRYERGKEIASVKRTIKVVDLPLGATEDRLVGTLDIERALKDGIKALQPGILAEVNQGILYIDEVNLLDDHLVDVLLDSAAMGVNIVEREGISLSHPARFILVGTMNPEEGELRPQLLDRFGLSVEVTGLKDVEERVKIVEVVEDFQKAPLDFCRTYEHQQHELREQIVAARVLLNNVDLPTVLVRAIAEICIKLSIDGHRADFLIARAAKTIAAFNGREQADKDDVKEAVELVLPHRMRRKPFEEPQPFQQEAERIINEHQSPCEQHQYERDSSTDPESDSDTDDHNEPGGMTEDVFDIGVQRQPQIKVARDRKQRAKFGRRADTLTSNAGKYIKSRIPENMTSDIALDATIRASIARTGTLDIQKEDLREKVRKKRTAAVIVFVVDASGSMGVMRRMEAAKGAVMALLEEAYQKRDKVGFIAFRHDRAEVLLPPTSSIELAAKYLAELPTGGKTPISDGLYQGLRVLKQERVKNSNLIPILVLVSDGKGNVPLNSNVKHEVISLAREIKERCIRLVVINSENGFLDIGYSKEIAEASGGSYHHLDHLDARSIVNVIKPLTEADQP